MESEKLYQVSTLMDFENKGYDGLFPTTNLKTYGNTGFGTFHALNGEMILIDDIMYRALGDCSVEVVKEEDSTPFATLGFTTKEVSIKLKIPGDMSSFKNELDKLRPNNTDFVLSRIDGEFEKIVIHGVWPVENPYEALKDIVEAQEICVFENIKGTLIGVWCPKEAKGINVVGWHFHFVSKDKKVGGHVNDLISKEVTIHQSIKKEVVVLK